MMMTLQDILFGVKLQSIIGDREVQISGIAFDSRQVQKGHLFVAVKGLTVDGHDFIEKAIESGAVAVVCETMPAELKEGVAYVQTADSSYALGICASNFYDKPSEKLKLVGITGTNGKTTVATLCHDLFSELGYKSGLLSTVENRIGEQVTESKYTTGDAIQINRLLSQMVAAGCTHCFMEVSSQIGRAHV